MSDHTPGPADLASHRLDELVDAFRAHRSALLRTRWGAGSRADDVQRGCALSALAVAAAIVSRLEVDRGATLLAAFRAGATLAEAVDATGGVDYRILMREVTGSLAELAATGQLRDVEAVADVLSRVEGEAIEMDRAHARIEHLGAGGAPADQVDEWLAAWVLEGRRGEQADGEVQP